PPFRYLLVRGTLLSPALRCPESDRHGWFILSGFSFSTGPFAAVSPSGVAPVQPTDPEALAYLRPSVWLSRQCPCLAVITLCYHAICIQVYFTFMYTLLFGLLS
ncbi:Hypothetical predicted protein, partial [Pelobates cultripes]